MNVAPVDSASPAALFQPSTVESHLEILRILDENPPDTITIIAIGPLTNLALAASRSPSTFIRAKCILVMGGSISVPGNMTPVGEFNAMADAYAAARVYALTSPDPAGTMPPVPTAAALTAHVSERHSSMLPPYPPKEALGDRRLNVILFPLDITTSHVLRRDEFEARTIPLGKQGSPLAEWTGAFVEATFRKMESLYHGYDGMSTSFSLHDPLCIWYALSEESQRALWTIDRGEDIRVETAGQWTRGMHVIDRRRRKKFDAADARQTKRSSDTGGWLSPHTGNRLGRCVGTPGESVLATLILDTVYGLR